MLPKLLPLDLQTLLSSTFTTKQQPLTRLRALQTRSHCHDRPEIGDLGRRSPYSPEIASMLVKIRLRVIEKACVYSEWHSIGGFRGRSPERDLY